MKKNGGKNGDKLNDIKGPLYNVINILNTFNPDKIELYQTDEADILLVKFKKGIIELDLEYNLGDNIYSGIFKTKKICIGELKGSYIKIISELENMLENMPPVGFFTNKKNSISIPFYRKPSIMERLNYLFSSNLTYKKAYNGN